MAKRAPANETPYSPLDPDLARSVMDGMPAGMGEKATADSHDVQAQEKPRKSRTPQTESEKVVQHPTVANAISAKPARELKRLGREKRVLLSPDEEREIERLVDRIGEDLGTSLKLSHLLRACMTLLCHAEGELHSATATLGPIIRPAMPPAFGTLPSLHCVEGPCGPASFRTDMDTPQAAWKRELSANCDRSGTTILLPGGYHNIRADLTVASAGSSYVRVSRIDPNELAPPR